MMEIYTVSGTSDINSTLTQLISEKTMLYTVTIKSSNHMKINISFIETVLQYKGAST
jgi:hypothetical protein